MNGDDELGRTIRQLVRERRAQTDKEHIAPEDLAAYFDRALTPQRAEEVEAHLAWCPDCVQELAALKELDGGFGTLPPAAVSDERIEASFQAALAVTDERQGHRRRALWLVPAAGLSAALLLVALILPRILRSSGSSAPGIEVGAAGVPSVDMDFSTERSPGDPVTRIHLPPGERLFVLVPWFSPQPESSLLQVMVLDSQSRVAWRSKPFRNATPPRDHFTLVLGRDLLPEKRYTVRIEQLGPGKPRTVGERAIEIVPLRTP